MTSSISRIDDTLITRQNKPVVLSVEQFRFFLDQGDSCSFRAIITPAVAKAMLDCNTFNRNLKINLVNRMAKEIKDGRWNYNGESISFNTDKRVHDGQNRLNACVASDMPIESLVVFGVPSETIYSVDRGVGRSVSDHMQLLGKTNTLALAAAVAHMYRLQRSQLPNLSLPVQPYEAEIILADHPALHEHVSTCPKALRNMITPSSYAFFRVVFDNIDIQKSEEFFSKLESGLFSQEDDPVKKLYVRLLENSRSKSSIDRVEKLALIIKAWNHHYEGNKLKQLKWTNDKTKKDGKGNENFPQIRGCQYATTTQEAA